MEQPQHRFARAAASGQLPARQIHSEASARRMSPSAKVNSEKAHQAARATPAQVSRARVSRSAFSKPPAPCSAQDLKDQELWNSTEDLFWDHMREVQNKWNTLKLNDDIWAKLIYFEQNRRLAKAYVSTPVLTIDGSTNGLDGFRIGLSGIENSYRDLDSMACLSSIGHGIKLKIDQHGNILIRKVAPPLATVGANGAAPQQSACSIWVKKWPSAAGRHSANSHSLTSSSSSSASSSSSSNSDYSHLTPPDQWPMREITDTDISYKLFDMQKFRSQLERQVGRGDKSSADTLIDWRQCVSIISFVRQTPAKTANGRAKLLGQLQHKQPLLSDPCWIMLINIIAIDMLKSSICDENYASPKPINQMSSMIDNYQHQARQAARVRRKLPDFMMTGATIDENVALDAASKGPEGRSKPADRLYWKKQAQEDDQPAASSNSARLRRLSNSTQITHSSSGNLKEPANHTRQSSQQEGRLTSSSSSQQLAGVGSIYGGATSGSVSSFSNNAIYTTFTGKYLDKHQRNRMPRKSSVDDLATRQRSPMDSLYPIDSMLSGSSRRLAQLNASSRWRSPSPMFEPVSQPMGATRIPFARRPMNERAQQKQLSHSLSAFDLSHGLKLNLSSLKAIKMNFDSDEEDEDDKQVQLQHANKENERVEKSGKVKRSERAISAFNNEASEWANLAKRYSQLNSSKSTNELNCQASQTMDEDEGIKNSSSSQLLDEGEDGDKKRKETIKIETKQNASAASSSSGCADHDYIVSHSSSSMTSSTHTSSGAMDEGVVSQPTSSSGIAGSGNTSDEYEKESRLATAETDNRKQSDRQINSISKRGTVKDLPPQEVLELRGDDQQAPSSKSVQQIQRRQQKAAISQNRRYKTKRVVDENIDHLNCEAQCCHHLEEQRFDEQHCDCLPDQHLGHHELDGPRDTCDCCCDCFYKPDDHDNHELPLSPHLCDLPEDMCDCGAFQDIPEDPIYDHLPRFGQSPGKGAKSKGRRKSSKNNSCNDLTTIYDHDDIESAPMPDDAKGKIKRAPSKELKRANGWLEKRKYIRLFPKFMFSSSSSSSADPASCSPESPTNKLAKSNTMDRNNSASEKFQRSRSSQNLVRTNYW